METMEIDVRKMTVAEFREMELEEGDLNLYELIDGELVKRSAPTPEHQELLSDLNDAVKSFVKQKQLGKVYFAPVDVYLDGYNATQPDLLFIFKDNLSIVTKIGIEGIPTLLVEIISLTSAYRDRVTKKELYERVGVAEYWLVDPVEGLIEVFTLENGRYRLLSAASGEEGQFQSKALDGFTLDVKTLF